MEREDLIDALRELIHEAHEFGLSGISIRIVWGAALRLAYFDRESTVDIDARISPLDDLQPIISKIADSRHWPVGWLNDDAKLFIPVWGRPVAWQQIFDDGAVSIEVASIDALLAMKLLAARPGRDTGDIIKLLALNGIASVSEAEELFEQFYPGDALPDKSIRLLERILSVGIPAPPVPPPPIDFV